MGWVSVGKTVEANIGEPCVPPWHGGSNQLEINQLDYAGQYSTLPYINSPLSPRRAMATTKTAWPTGARVKQVPITTGRQPKMAMTVNPLPKRK